ncbi:MAG: serine/threonine protein kinase [Gemmatimonadaceae bacterium]|nr:serine/threonine protein kinase [Gemmatimonadaceae bacterium]
MVGSKIAGYTIQSEVGEGGTSAVYKALHPSHGTVALKVLREKLRHDRTAVARFVREAQYGTRVQHPNVVRTIEIGESDSGMHFLAIEWAPGDLLEKYAKQNAPLSCEEAAVIITQIGAAVHAAHAARIVHRDLKPENVMYDPESQRVKLLDFGIATDVQAPADERLTRAGFFVGSLMYIAPEALSGEIVTPAADQYSLATMAYYLLTRALPYTAKAPREMFTQLLTLPPIPLNSAKEKLKFSPAIERVVMKALSKEPGDRFPDVMAFTKAFQEAVSIPALQAQSETPIPEEPGILARMRGILRRGS